MLLIVCMFLMQFCLPWEKGFYSGGRLICLFPRSVLLYRYKWLVVPASRLLPWRRIDEKCRVSEWDSNVIWVRPVAGRGDTDTPTHTHTQTESLSGTYSYTGHANLVPSHPFWQVNHRTHHSCSSRVAVYAKSVQRERPFTLDDREYTVLTAMWKSRACISYSPIVWLINTATNLEHSL